MFKRTKIVCTMGPACDSDDILREMMKAGMNVARFNFSHGSYEEHHGRIERVRRIAPHPCCRPRCAGNSARAGAAGRTGRKDRSRGL